MRFPLAAMLFLISSFIFFVSWAVSSYLITTVDDALSPLSTGFSTSGFADVVTLLPWAFGILCAIFFIAGILLIFVLDSLADEPEMYWR